MTPSSARAGHFLSSILAAWISCFSSRIWSSVSRIVKLGFRPDQLGMPPQQPRRQRMERAEPPALDRPADERAHPRLHLVRGLVGEGDGEDLRRIGAAGRQDVREPRGQHPRLAGAGAGQHQHGAVDRLDRRALRLVQGVDIAARGSRGPLLRRSVQVRSLPACIAPSRRCLSREMKAMGAAALCPARRSTDIVTTWTTDASCASPRRSPIPRASRSSSASRPSRTWPASA